MEGSVGNDPAIKQARAGNRAAPPPPQLLAVVPEFEKLEGWLGIEAAQFLFEAAAAVRSGCIVEIGSYRGRSTIALCAGSRSGARVPVYAIEPHEDFVGVKGGVYGPSDRRAFFRNLFTMKFASLVRLINASSEVVAPGWDKPVSLLFIDGDHRYDAVYLDFNLWRPHLFDGAVVIFQDAPGPGPAAVIKDNVAAGLLTPLAATGQMAMFRYNLAEESVEHGSTSFMPGVSLYPGLHLQHPAPEPGPVRAGTANTLFSYRKMFLYQAIAGCRAASVKPLLTELDRLAPDTSEFEMQSEAGPDLLEAKVRAELMAEKASYFRFVFVRDPYARLAAVFNNKIARGYRKGQHRYIDMITNSAAALGIPVSETITFEEFVKVVAAQEVDEMNALWRPQYIEGQFARVKFDVVGRVETMATDFSYIFEQLGAPNSIMHKAILPNNIDGARVAIWSEVSASTRAAFLKTFAIDFDTLRYPQRRSSILFSPAASYMPGYTPPDATPPAAA
jgi:predicted O-methyltransferase YrrM